MKVYVVTTGSYSAYGIDRIFASEADAESYAALRNRGQAYENARVEPYDVDDHVPASRTVYQCWQKLTGPNLLTHVGERSWVAIAGGWAYDFDRPRVDVAPPDAEGDVAYRSFWRRPYAEIAVTATCLDRDLALKALHDRMAAIRAKAAGL